MISGVLFFTAIKHAAASTANTMTHSSHTSAEVLFLLLFDSDSLSNLETPGLDAWIKLLESAVLELSSVLEGPECISLPNGIVLLCCGLLSCWLPWDVDFASNLQFPWVEARIKLL